jgi:predicted metal-dependent TIM-barrel fold hydrolase
MRFIDAHLHSDMVEDVQLQKLVMMGMEAAVVPSPHMFLGSPPVDTLFRIWDRFVTMEVTTARTLGYESFASLSVPFIGLGQSDTERALALLPGLLEHERVVAMGEIGLDTGTEYEKDLFREHLRIAKAHDLPVILHTPIRFAPQGETVTPMIVQIIKEEGFPLEKCVFDHAAEATLDLRMKTGGMVGLSVCWDKLPPEPAARYVVDNPGVRSKVIINSELGGEGNDYFMVPRVILAMRLLGLDKAIIDEVCYQNPKEFFGLPLD